MPGSALLWQTELANDAGDQQPQANHPYQVDRHISCLVFTVHQRVSPSTSPESAAFASTPDVTDPTLATRTLDNQVHSTIGALRTFNPKLTDEQRSQVTTRINDFAGQTLDHAWEMEDKDLT
jgi:hypothetical protein